MLIFFKTIINKNNKILELHDPIYFFKAIKGKQEIENIKKAHIYDGVALTKYLFWLKKNFDKKRITEITASQKLLKFRKKIKVLNSQVFQQYRAQGLMELLFIIKQRERQIEN